MSAFHLRPVPEASPSPTPSASTTRSSEQSTPLTRDTALPTSLLPSTPSAMSRSRRPLSPTSLRDIDLSHDADTLPRKYPAPPTGHDLMALFPPAPPDNFPEMRPGPTSGYFQRQERAFFAQAGKEIVRVRVEVDVPHEVDLPVENGKAKGRELGAHRIWPQGHAPHGSHSHHQSPIQSPVAPPVLYPHPSSRPSRGGVPVPVTPTSAFPTTHTQSANPHPGTPHQSSLDPAAPNMKVEFQSEEYRDDDEAWRRPMPYAERRRAGKHTRRVIVRN